MRELGHPTVETSRRAVDAVLRLGRYAKVAAFPGPDTTRCDAWPKPPIWPKGLPLIRELLTDEEYAELLRQLVQALPNGPLVEPERILRGPSARSALQHRK